MSGIDVLPHLRVLRELFAAQFAGVAGLASVLRQVYPQLVVVSEGFTAFTAEMLFLRMLLLMQSARMEETKHLG